MDTAEMNSLFAEAEEEAQNSLEVSPREMYMDYVVSNVMELRNSHDIDIEEADTRFSTVLPLRKVRNASVAIIGAGGLGNWQWRVLLGMGFRRVSIFDDDTVGIENIGPQAHSILDLGIPKVEAVRQAALVYRGVEIQTVNSKVHSLSEIKTHLGYVPDIVITCTDSAEFRKGFFDSMLSNRIGTWRVAMDRYNHGDLPKLWLDYRMSLGDWTCYALPLDYMVYGMTPLDKDKYLSGYYAEAMFSSEEAVQEPCTARAIVYTGANVASYTGAYLHWYFTKFLHMVDADDDHELEEVLRLYWEGEFEMQPKMTFSARDWEFITESKAERSLRAKLIEARARVALLEDELEQLRNGTTSQPAEKPEDTPKLPEEEDSEGFEEVSWNDLQPGDIVNFASLDIEGERCEIVESHDRYMLVEYSDGSRTRVNIRYGTEIRRYNAPNNSSE